MKTYQITIMLKSGILDNAGKATLRALNNLGFPEVVDVKIGKVVLVSSLNEPIDIAKALTNEIMETYTIKCLDDVD